MRSEYKELMRKLINTCDDLFMYSKNEGSLSDKSKKEIKELDRIIKEKINKIEKIERSDSNE